MRLHVNAGTHVPTYEAQGEMTILCVQGRVSVEFASSSSDLSSGQLLYLLTNEPFSLFGQEESSLLITVLRDTGPLAPPMIGSAG
uniref:Cupin domain-containing protein n=1 Tax=Schlesneria paludicola TaxID=360056 RepID=A0A7C2P7A3_9PLAN